jgi:preprotein translocase subunit SecA
VRTLNAWTKGVPVSGLPLASNIRPKVQDNVVQFPNKKIGRNEACPCGSGKKFKKCCGDGN